MELKQGERARYTICLIAYEVPGSAASQIKNWELFIIKGILRVLLYGPGY